MTQFQIISKETDDVRGDNTIDLNETTYYTEEYDGTEEKGQPKKCRWFSLKEVLYLPVRYIMSGNNTCEAKEEKMKEKQEETTVPDEKTVDNQTTNTQMQSYPLCRVLHFFRRICRDTCRALQELPKRRLCVSPSCYCKKCVILTVIYAMFLVYTCMSANNHVSSTTTPEECRVQTNETWRWWYVFTKLKIKK